MLKYAELNRFQTPESRSKPIKSSLLPAYVTQQSESKCLIKQANSARLSKGVYVCREGLKQQMAVPASKLLQTPTSSAFEPQMSDLRHKWRIAQLTECMYVCMQGGAETADGCDSFQAAAEP